MVSMESIVSMVGRAVQVVDGVGGRWSRANTERDGGACSGTSVCGLVRAASNREKKKKKRGKQRTRA